MNPMRRIVGLVAFALVVVSCGGDSSNGDTGTSDTQAPSAPAATDPPSDGSYDTVRAMQLDVEAAFYLCNAPMKTYDPPLVEGAVAQADCSKDVSFYIFDPSDVSAGVGAIQGEAEGALSLLVGVNWIISCAADEATCGEIHAVTGGELLAG